jgi:DNA-binding transcriptional regulator YiaG
MKGNDLKIWRKKWSLSQVGLAKLFNVDVMTISRWERGIQQPTPLLPLALEALEQRLRKEEEKRHGKDQEVN